MKVAEEILSACKNMQFYSDQIYALAQKEFDFACDYYDLSHPSAKGFIDALESIGAVKSAIDFRLYQVTRNVEHIKKTHLPAMIPKKVE